MKVAFVGAGSTVFAKTLIGDLLSIPEFAGPETTLALMDVEAERLRTSEIVAGRVAAAVDAKPRVEATLDRRAALDGADYVLTMFQVGGYRPATVIDFDVPQRFGLRQTIGDTLGIGGIMRGLRTIPVLLDVCRDMEQLCPDALLLQYVNPMAMLSWAVARASPIRTVERSERIRTYNFPENRITDHRVGFKAHNLDQVLDGDLDALFDALAAADKQARLQQA